MLWVMDTQWVTQGTEGGPVLGLHGGLSFSPTTGPVAPVRGEQARIGLPWGWPRGVCHFLLMWVR